jgi:hypothetical protein
MFSSSRRLRHGALVLLLGAAVSGGLARDADATGEAAASPTLGRGDVYANIPAKDDRGRDQITMFRQWNPDPLGNHEASLRALNPLLARVVRKAQSDNPELRFVIGSGKRDLASQRKAYDWGWSKTRTSRHQSGDAVDLWPLDSSERVTFDPGLQARIGAAMKKAAADLQVAIRWGGHFQSFKSRDRSHFELAPQSVLAGSAGSAPSRNRPRHGPEHGALPALQRAN